MTHVLLLALALGLPSATPLRSLQGTPAAADAAEILSRAAERHRDLSSLQASFTQRIRNPVLESDETSAGIFYYRAPLSYRIAFTQPPHDLVVSTGSEVWIYLPSSQPGQVIKSAVRPGTKGFAPYQFIYDFKDDYDAALLGEEPVGGRPSYHLALTPASRTADYTRAELWVDKETFLTRAIEVQEQDGLVRRFTLADHRLNPALPASLFSFTPPRGVEVFEQ
jgi:outer membrane lipoprotein carrier protein